MCVETHYSDLQQFVHRLMCGIGICIVDFRIVADIIVVVIIVIVFYSCFY